MIPKKEIIKKFEIVFESFGFVPIDTPALEYTEILLGKGGGDTDKQIYRFKDHGDRDISLRYDLTVPLARFVAEHFNELTFPFKRYHIAPVWRGENTQKGRYREFYQCDFDILGSNSENADLEILLVIKKGLEVLSAGDYRINVNNRKILNVLFEKFGIIEKKAEILRAIDKFYKIGIENVIKELSEAGLDNSISEKLMNFLGLNDKNKSMGFTGEDIFSILEKFRIETGDENSGCILETERIFKILKDMDILEFFAFNPAITRGLDYYTGIIFESFILDKIEFGSVCSGGRYDNLTNLYSKNIVPGVGASFGLDRIISLLESKKLLSDKATKTDILIFNLDNNFISEYQTLAQYFRNNGLNCEIFYEKQKIVNQFKFAEKKAVKYVLISGEEELKSGRYNLKDIKIGEERKSLTKENIVKFIKG